MASTTAMVSSAEQQPLSPPATAVTVADPTVARNESIAQLLNAAYQRSSMLELSDEESTKLMAPFPDDAYSRRDAKRGDQSIVYLEHAYIRDRLLQVFGPGKWTTINRRQWVDKDSDTIYVDMVMLARGTYIGESVGCQRYDIGGHRLSYGEALSGAESDALSRICGKILGIGLEAWKKAFREEWKRRNPVGGHPDKQDDDGVASGPRPGVRENPPFNPPTSAEQQQHATPPPKSNGGGKKSRTPEEVHQYYLGKITEARFSPNSADGEALLAKIKATLPAVSGTASAQRQEIDQAIAEAETVLGMVDAIQEPLKSSDAMQLASLANLVGQSGNAGRLDEIARAWEEERGNVSVDTYNRGVQTIQEAKTQE